jgi:hypothetical protein
MRIIGEDKLLEKINAKRRVLFDFASKYGLTDCRVVELSQEIDVLINKIQLRRVY